MIKAQKKWAQRKTLDRTFKIGDKVWLEGRNLHLDRPSIKLSPKRHGPFKIKKVLSPITYQLDLPIQWKIHDVFHINLLTPYQETNFHGLNFAQPPPDLINGEEEYEVEQILDARRHGRGCKVQYLIKWKGYPNLDNQWVNWDDLHAEEALKDFRKRQPDAPTHTRRAKEGDETAEPLMTSHVNSSPSFTPSQEGSRLPSEIAGAFLSWRPTVPSSWVTPPGSDSANTPNSPCSDNNSPIRQDFYVSQMLIYTPDNLHLYAAHTPYSAPTTLDAKDTCSHTSANSFPCPTPEPVPHTNTDPIPIPPCLVTEHPVGPLHPDSWPQGQPPLPLPDSSSMQEAKKAQADTGGEVPPGTTGTDGSSNAWEDANQGVTWEDYRLPPAKGFVLNDGLDYIPFDIRLPNGDYKPAKYIKIEWGEDPLIYGMINGNPHQYVESFQATPMPSAGPLRTYSPSQLKFFKENHDLCPEIDKAAHQLYDKGVLAEMECYRHNKVALERNLREEAQIQNDIWKWRLTLGGCAHHMAGARILQRIEVVNRSKLHLLMQEYKHRRRR